MNDESKSISYSSKPEFLFTHIDADSNKRHPNETFDPTKILDEKRNLELYCLWQNAPAGSFKKLAVEVFSKDPLIIETMQKAGLLLDYYIYTMQYMFEIRKWAPKGAYK
jgi:hypothetical protein